MLDGQKSSRVTRGGGIGQAWRTRDEGGGWVFEIQNYCDVIFVAPWPHLKFPRVKSKFGSIQWEPLSWNTLWNGQSGPFEQTAQLINIRKNINIYQGRRRWWWQRGRTPLEIDIFVLKLLILGFLNDYTFQTCHPVKNGRPWYIHFITKSSMELYKLTC